MTNWPVDDTLAAIRQRMASLGDEPPGDERTRHAVQELLRLLAWFMDHSDATTVDISAAESIIARFRKLHGL